MNIWEIKYFQLKKKVMHQLCIDVHHHGTLGAVFSMGAVHLS